MRPVHDTCLHLDTKGESSKVLSQEGSGVGSKTSAAPARNKLAPVVVQLRPTVSRYCPETPSLSQVSFFNPRVLGRIKYQCPLIKSFAINIICYCKWLKAQVTETQSAEQNPV